jgi:hypothetical protein
MKISILREKIKSKKQTEDSNGVILLSGISPENF